MGKLAAKVLRIWRGAPVEAKPDPTLASLQGEVDRLRATVADVQLQWAEVLDKIAAWGNRQAARDRKRVRESLEAPQNDEDGLVEADGAAVPPREASAGLLEPSNGVPAGSKADLYARMRARGIR